MKIVQPNSREVEIYEYLRMNDISSPNHTLPVDIIQGDRPFLIMPAGDTTYLTRNAWRLCDTLDDFYQIVEVWHLYWCQSRHPLFSAARRALNSCINITLPTW